MRSGRGIKRQYIHPLPLVTITERIDTWRHDAAVLRGYGDDRTAALLERLAAELEIDLQDGAAEVVDLTRAVELTGYTRGHLRRLLTAGKLRNIGTLEEPAFLASELPRKPGQPTPHLKLAPPAHASTSLRVQVARAVVSGD
jgi:hypothetical protein